MPRQNRVTPFGALIATPERGTFMGNRGLLHDDQGRLRRAWQVKRWLLCLLEFRGRNREVMKPGHYTELFFLDEATGLAAGHRPCFECRRERFNAFRQAWSAGKSGGIVTAGEINDRLHDERLTPDSGKRLYRADLDELPDGVFIVGQSEGEALLIWKDRLLEWSPGGYRGPRPRPKGKKVDVLTPRSTVAAIWAGYVPQVHETAIAGV